MPRLPWTTLTICVTALLIQAGGASVQKDMQMLPLRRVTHEPWRWVTGHLTHADAGHLLWDLLPVLMLSCLVELLAPRRLHVLLLGAVVLTPPALWITAPDITHYRGLSGVAAGLWVAAAGLAYRRGWITRGWLGAALLGLAAKLAVEGVGPALFADLPAGWRVVPGVHAAGAAAGALSLVRLRRASAVQCGSDPSPTYLCGA